MSGQDVSYFTKDSFRLIRKKCIAERLLSVNGICIFILNPETIRLINDDYNGNLTQVLKEEKCLTVGDPKMKKGSWAVKTF